MPTNAPTTENQYSFPRPRAPGWLSCELCERPAARPPRRLRLTLVRHDADDPPDAIGDGASPREAGDSAMLVLLCGDCCALIVGVIDDDEWRRRTNDSPAPINRPQLSPPPSKVDSSQITSSVEES
jgi:hypothetical protein